MDEFDGLFRAYHAPIVRYLSRLLGDGDLAEELAQETFLRALRHGPVSHVRGWLFAVATNLTRDHARREARQRRHFELLQAEEQERERRARDVGFISSDSEEDRSLAREALAMLSERDRTALYLNEEGLSYPEIAAALGLSVQSVGTTLTRARKRAVQGYESLVRTRGNQQGGGASVAS